MLTIERMSRNVFRIDDRDLLRNVAAFHSGFHTPSVILDGLAEEHASAKPHGLPHSIADIVGHMCYWQDFFNAAVENGYKGLPEHASEGWPQMEAGGWPALRERFLASVARTKELATGAANLDQPLLPDDVRMEFLERESLGSGLLHGAIHSSHHLGQIVTIRQLLQLWPPAAGSMTW